MYQIPASQKIKLTPQLSLGTMYKKFITCNNLVFYVTRITLRVETFLGFTCRMFILSAL